MITLRNVGE